MPARKPDGGAALRRLGDVVVRKRILAGKTQEAVAEGAGLSVQFLRRVERGSGNPSYLTLRAIATAIGTDMATLIQAAEAAGA
jgi:transcriptional regulator with XRE-family HTH domain